MIFDINSLSAFNPDTGFDFSAGAGNFGNYADFGSMVDGSGTNLFAGQLDAFQPTWGQRALGGLNDLGETFANNQGLLNFGVNALSGLGSLYQGNKQMSMYKKQLDQQASQWNKQYRNQVNDYNERLSDRQRQRVAANPNNESVESYMQKYGAK